MAVRVTSGGALTVTSATCSFNFGDIDLGSTGYVFLFPAVFQGSGSDASTVAWNASAKKLTIVLGLLQPSLTLMGTVSSSVATYTPSGAVTDSAGNAVAGPFSTGNVKQF